MAEYSSCSSIIHKRRGTLLSVIIRLSVSSFSLPFLFLFRITLHPPALLPITVALAMERREETTPLLNDTLSPAGYKTTSVASDNDDCITILTSNPPSLASRRSSTSSSSSKGTTQKQDDIVARRLNGASLLTVLGS